MNLQKKLAVGFSTAALVFSSFALPSLAAENTVVVTDASPDGWQVQHGTCGAPTTGSQRMENGPSTPPEGTGSREFTIGTNGDSFETYRNANYHGLDLADITELSYSTFVQQFGSGGQAPYLILNVDTDGDMVSDDQLFFEPVYQTGAYGGDSVPNQGNVTLNTWQTWNAFTGGWWLNTGGPPLITLASYIADNPTAQIVNTATGQGGIRIATGCGGAAWANFVGNADAFVLSVEGGDTTTYDFEFREAVVGPANPNACKKGGWMDFSNPKFKNQGDCVSWYNKNVKNVKITPTNTPTPTPAV